MKKKIYKQFETKKFFSRENLAPKKKPPPLSLLNLLDFSGSFSPMIQLLTPNSFVYFRQ